MPHESISCPAPTPPPPPPSFARVACTPVKKLSPFRRPMMTQTAPTSYRNEELEKNALPDESRQPPLQQTEDRVTPRTQTYRYCRYNNLHNKTQGKCNTSLHIPIHNWIDRNLQAPGEHTPIHGQTTQPLWYLNIKKNTGYIGKRIRIESLTHKKHTSYN